MRNQALVRMLSFFPLMASMCLALTACQRAANVASDDSAPPLQLAQAPAIAAAQPAPASSAPSGETGNGELSPRELSMLEAMAILAAQGQQAGGEPSDEALLAAANEERLLLSQVTALDLMSLRRANRQLRVRACDAPNIIMIVVDDLGYADLGPYGQERIKTPNIDQMANEGTRFTNYYAGAPVATPSHCTLMTGLHTGHCRLRANNDNLSLEPDDVTLSEVLWKGGYTTAVAGKWPLGAATTPGAPTKQGFDDSYGFLSLDNAMNHFPPYLWRKDEKQTLTGNAGGGKEYLAHELFEEASLNFIGNVGQPFFLYFSVTPPHADITEWPSLKPYENEDWPEPQKRYAAMITRVDETVGKILDKLKDTKRDRRTIVFLTADNGPHDSNGVDPEFFDSNGRLSGIKGSLNEGGIRVPMIVWGTGIKKGRVDDAVWCAYDLLPTVAELTNCFSRPQNLDGISQAAVLQGTGGGHAPHREFLYWESHEGGFTQAVRYKTWKGIRDGLNGTLRLYDLEADPGEKIDVARLNSEIVEKIEDFLSEARTESAHWPVGASQN